MDATRDAARDTEEPRSLVALFSDLWRETWTLLRDETDLAKAEISEKVDRMQTGIASLAIGGAVVFAGFLCLLAAAVAGLAHALPPDMADWLSPLIIGAIVVIIGFIMLAAGRSTFKSENLAPTRTMRSMRRDAQLAREHMA